ncbi:MAG: DUF559 domain-containing protein [Desertimonas sp.]
MEPERRRAINQQAAEQAGAVSRGQLRELGITTAELKTLQRQGHLIPAAPRVYVVGGSPSTTGQRLHVGLLCLGDRAVVSHEAAARLHRLDGAPSDAVEFTIDRSARGRRVPFVVHTTRCWGRTDRVRAAGLRCTSATRTILDLASASVSAARLEAAIDAAVRMGLTSPTVLAAQLAERHDQRGSRAIAALLPDTGGHTWLERRFLELLRHHGLARPTTQRVHRVGGRTVARTDFCWDDLGVVVEVSGRLGHASDAERARDAQRRNELQDLGRLVYEFTRTEVVDRPAQVVATLRRLLAVREPVTR